MNLPKSQTILTAGVGIVAILLVGLAVLKQQKAESEKTADSPEALSPLSPGGGSATPPVGGGTTPPSPRLPSPAVPVPTPVPVDSDTKSAVIERINLAPESKYTQKEKLLLRSILNEADKVERVATVLFESSSNAIVGSNKDALDTMAKAYLADFNSQPEFQFVAVGYASPDGGVDLNMRLAEERAATVVAYLTDSLKFNSKRVRKVFIGPTDFLDKNERGKNRAVEVWLTRIPPGKLGGF